MQIRLASTLRMDPLILKAKGLPAEIQAALVDTADEVVEDIRANWSGYYPPASNPGEPPAVRNGELSASVEAAPMFGAAGGVFQVVIRAGAPYANYLEYGTYKMAARPFMRPAAKRAKNALPARIKAVFDK